MAYTSTIIVPLYQYPLNRSSWKPLIDAILSHSTMEFIIIINPNSGPGVEPAGWLPDEGYTRAIPALTICPNVRIVGYVRLDYCKRTITEVEQDIRKYANWKNLTTITGVHGIFFDETPNLYADVVARYLDRVGCLVKCIPGIAGDRLILHNPGTVPDPEYSGYWQSDCPPDSSVSCVAKSQSAGAAQILEPVSPQTLQQYSAISFAPVAASASRLGAPSIIIVFEESYQAWRSEPHQTRLNALLRYGREHCGYIVHSVPLEAIHDLTRELRIRGRYLYITDLCQRYYESWGPGWSRFVQAMDV